MKNNKGGFEVVFMLIMVGAVPLIMSLYHEVGWLRSERKKAAEKQQKIEAQEKANENKTLVRK